MWIEYIPLPDTLPLGEKHSGTKSLWVPPLTAAPHSSLSADVFLRSGAGNIFNPRPCNSLLYTNVTPPVLLRLLADETLRAYTLLFVQQTPVSQRPDEPATSGGAAT